MVESYRQSNNHLEKLELKVYKVISDILEYNNEHYRNKQIYYNLQQQTFYLKDFMLERID